MLVAVLASFAGAAETRRVTIQGHGVALGETPVVVELAERLDPGPYVLTPLSGRPIRGHVFEDDGTLYLGLVLEWVKADEPRTYVMKPVPDDSHTPPAVSLRREGANVRVAIDGKLFTEYLTDAGPKPYLYPVIGPAGVPVTRDFPMKKVAGEDQDHPHQRSFWFTHGKVNGIDFWSEQAGHGSIRETAQKTLASGPAVGVLRTTDDWLGPDGRKVCEDERVLRFYDTDSVRVLDFDITIKAATGPVTFGDTKEGMFGLRVASSMDVARKQGGRITNAEGLTDAAAWGQPSPWVDYAGPVAGRTVGIAILNHPDSFRYPTTWHVRDYGLFAANPFGWHDFGMKTAGDYTIPTGQSITFRYRIVLHEGKTDPASLTATFQGYARPPRVEIED
jgi:hypothetical protein